MTNPTPHGQVPEALRLALSIDLMDTFTDYQQEELNKAAAELRLLHAENARLSGLCDKWNSECDEFREDNKRLAALVEAQQHTRIAELEAARFAYASEFDPNGDGYPDVGSIHANIRAMKAKLASIGAGGAQALSAAPASPWSRALEIRMAQGWKLKGDRVPVLYTDSINGEGVGRDDLWLCTTGALAASPTPPAEQPIGEVVVTKTKDGQIVAVTRQDDEGRILSVIATSDPEEQQATPKAAPASVAGQMQFGGCPECGSRSCLARQCSRTVSHSAQATPGVQWMCGQQASGFAAPQQEAQEPATVPYQKLTNEIDLILSDQDTDLSIGAKRALLWMRTWVSVPLYTAPQQPATHVQNPAEIEHVAGNVSKTGPESNMAQQPAPSAAAASKAVLKAIREANMQLVRTGGDAFMLVPYKVATTGAALGAEQAAPKAAPESFLDGADVQDESGVLAYYSREAVLACITAALESVAAPKAALGEPSDWKPLKTSKEGRDAVRSLFREKLKRHDFDEYIMKSLAADFACVLGGYLRAAPQQEAQEPTAFIHWPINGPPRLVWYSQKALNDAILKTHEDGYKPDVKLYTAPQPAPAPLSDDDLVELGKSKKSGLHPWGIGTTRADYLRAVRAVLDASRKQGANHD